MFDFPEPNSPRFFRKTRYGTDKLILVRKNKIHYVEAGQGDPVILIPGSTGTSRVWKRLMPLMAGKYRLLALDYFHADSAEKDQFRGISEQTDLIAQMVRQLGIEKVHLMGAGTGGTIAFDLAARYSEMVSKIVAILGYLILPQAPGQDSHKFISIENELNSIKASILYLYGTRTNERVISLRNNLTLLHKYQPRAWIVSLEGGIFETAMRAPAEVANLILDFLKVKG